MKKSFTSGLDSLLGTDPNSQKATKEAPRKGRKPAAEPREITKASQEGTKPGETRATFIIQEDILEDIKAIAYWEREKIKDVLQRALEAEIKRYKQTHKAIKPKPGS
jgi:hypothetical protein